MPNSSEKNQTHYLVNFKDPEKLTGHSHITLRVKSIQDSNLGLSFIALSGFIFERHSLIVDPKLENLRKRFEHTKSLHLSIYQIISIEEVGCDHQGLSFKNDRSNLLVLDTLNSTESQHPQD